MNYQSYIAAIDLRDAPVLVIGGGEVAERKVASLLRAGAQVRVVSPRLSQDLERRRQQGRIEWKAKRFQLHDLDWPSLLVFAATDEGATNRRIVDRARRRGKLVNGASVGAGRNFSTPASFEHDGLTFSVSSGGADLRRSIYWRDQLKSELQDQREDGQGHVTLVGAGPGGIGMLTIDGRRALANAEVVVYDNLVSNEILDYAASSAEKIFVGKIPFRATTSQEEINRLLVKEALAGRRVVRLKGGDPFIFGRGAEELEVLHHAGVSFDVIAGVSSLNGALAAAGVSITRRGRNIGFSVFAATPRTTQREIEAWGKTPGPVAVFMGIHAAASIAAGFVQAGRSPHEDVTVVARGGRAEQRVVVTTLAELGRAVGDTKEWTPALIVVGVLPEAGFGGIEHVLSQPPNVAQSTEKLQGTLALPA